MPSASEVREHFLSVLVDQSKSTAFLWEQLWIQVPWAHPSGRRPQERFCRGSPSMRAFLQNDSNSQPLDALGDKRMHGIHQIVGTGFSLILMGRKHLLSVWMSICKYVNF